MNIDDDTNPNRGFWNGEPNVTRHTRGSEERNRVNHSGRQAPFELLCERRPLRPDGGLPVRGEYLHAKWHRTGFIRDSTILRGPAAGVRQTRLVLREAS